MKIENELCLLKKAADSLNEVQSSLSARKVGGALEMTPVLQQARSLTETVIVFLDSSRELEIQNESCDFPPVADQEH